MRFFLVCCLLIWGGCSLEGAPPLLKKKDIKPSVQEMLDYHVEYKQWTPQLARRAVKLYIEQFDSEKLYLLSSEVKSFLQLSDSTLQEAVQNYDRGDPSEFTHINRVIEQSIVRARGIRAELQKEPVVATDLGRRDPYTDYPNTLQELKERMRKQLGRSVAIEKKLSTLTSWKKEEEEKAFYLWDKRMNRLENSYLTVSSQGTPLSNEMIEHAFSMHVLKAMAKSLDAHTSYFTPEEAFEMRASLEKQFEGIGVVLREGIEGVVITGLVKGGPAEKSGKIVPGDILYKINGHVLDREPYEKVLELLQGSSSGELQLELKRASGVAKPIQYSVTLKKEKIVMQEDRLQYSSEPFGDGIIGKLVLPSFYESGDDSGSEKDIRDALRALKKQGKLVGLVLDMRENSGGFLSQAVKVGGLFISSGVVVISKYSHGKQQYLRDVDGKSYYQGPLIVLTSRASASAAEIVAQALQDYGVALVVGDDRTYGKGTIQYQTITDQRAAAFFKVTVGRYYTVSGRSTQIDGVQADIVVPTIFSAYNIGERYLEYPLRTDRVPSMYFDPLLDIEQHNVRWFQKHYLPVLQKQVSTWTQILPQLKTNSTYRLGHDSNYSSFLKSLNSPSGVSFSQKPDENFGVDDLQMIESINLIKDMVLIDQRRAISNQL